MTEANADPGLGVAQVFLLESHFVHREDVLVLPAETKVPELKVNVTVTVLGQAGEAAAGLLIRVSTNDADQPVYRFDVTMVLVVQADPARPNLGALEYVTTAGVSALFPFVREAVANITGRGRFGTVYLRPINVQVVTNGLRSQEGSAQSSSQVAEAAPKSGYMKTSRRRKAHSKKR